MYQVPGRDLPPRRTVPHVLPARVRRDRTGQIQPSLSHSAHRRVRPSPRQLQQLQLRQLCVSGLCLCRRALFMRHRSTRPLCHKIALFEMVACCGDITSALLYRFCTDCFRVHLFPDASSVGRASICTTAGASRGALPVSMGEAAEGSTGSASPSLPCLLAPSTSTTADSATTPGQHAQTVRTRTTCTAVHASRPARPTPSRLAAAGSGGSARRCNRSAAFLPKGCLSRHRRPVVDVWQMLLYLIYKRSRTNFYLWPSVDPVGLGGVIDVQILDVAGVGLDCRVHVQSGPEQPEYLFVTDRVTRHAVILNNCCHFGGRQPLRTEPRTRLVRV